MRKYALVLVVSTVLAVSGGIGIATRSGSTPALAVAAPDVRIDPGDGRDLTATVAALEETLRRVPDDHVTWATLALAYVEQVRTSGDTTLYDQAEDAVARSVAIEPDENAPALVAKSAIRSVQHDFREALALANDALAIDPYHPAALALRIDALTELGRYDDQLVALRVADRRQPGAPIVARYAYASELRGDLGRAAAILRRGVTSATGGDRAHLLTLLADLDRRRGDLAGASELLAQVQRIDPSYLPALISRARVATAAGRLDRAAQLWKRVIARADHPEYFVELGEIYTVLGRPGKARAQFQVLEDYAAEMDSVALGRELDVALFLVDHADVGAGLAAARSEWQSRRAVPAADALGWALHRAGNSEKALRLARFATSLGTPDAAFWIHRGLIETSVGLVQAARRHLDYALGLDAGISPLLRQRAVSTLNRLR